MPKHCIYLIEELHSSKPLIIITTSHKKCVIAYLKCNKLLLFAFAHRTLVHVKHYFLYITIYNFLSTYFNIVIRNDTICTTKSNKIHISIKVILIIASIQLPFPVHHGSLIISYISTFTIKYNQIFSKLRLLRLHNIAIIMRPCFCSRRIVW